MASPTLSTLVRGRIRAHLEHLPARPTQAAIGEAINRTQTWVSHYLRGRHDIDLDTLGRLATFLGVDPRVFLVDGAHFPKAYASDVAEAVTLLQALSAEERATIVDMLRILARKPTSKRARS